MAASRTLLALAVAATMAVQLAMAANYTVGDSGGWEIGTDFKSWASSKKFVVGDVLIFEYSANHDVLEVNEADFSSCSASNPIEKHTDGNTAIGLSTAGKRFFICGVPGHCGAGMKLEIDTLATSSPPPEATPSPPPAPPTSSPSPPPESTPSPPPAPPTSSPAAPPKAAAKPPTKSPMAPPPDSHMSPPAPPPGPTPRSPAPAPEPPTPPFPFDLPLNPTAPPTTPPPPPSSAYKCRFRAHLSVGFSFVIIMLLAI